MSKIYIIAIDKILVPKQITENSLFISKVNKENINNIKLKIFSKLLLKLSNILYFDNEFKGSIY